MTPKITLPHGSIIAKKSFARSCETHGVEMFVGLNAKGGYRAIPGWTSHRRIGYIRASVSFPCRCGFGDKTALLRSASLACWRGR
jgi:hypothetical protein